MARSFSNAKRLSSLLSDRLSIAVSSRGFAAASHGGVLGNERGSGVPTMNKGGEETRKSTPCVPDPGFCRQSHQVHSFLNYIRPLSSNSSIKPQLPSMFSVPSGFSTISATEAQSNEGATFVNHTRPLSPHLSIYKPQSNSMLSISNRISAAFLSATVLAVYVSYMKMGVTCLSYYNVYQILFYAAGLQGLIYSCAVPALLLHIFHAWKH